MMPEKSKKGKNKSTENLWGLLKREERWREVRMTANQRKSAGVDKTSPLASY